MNLYQLLSNVWRVQLFRYLLVAGTAFLVDAFIYFIMYDFVLNEQSVFIGSFEIRAAMFSLLISFTFGFFVNFLLSKFLVFEKVNNTEIQLLRFILSAGVTFIGNYLLMHLLIEKYFIQAFIARCISAVTFAIVSFVAHKLFSFKN